MKRVAYNRYEPDAWVKPLSLQLVFNILIALLSMTFILLIAFYLIVNVLDNNLVTKIFSIGIVPFMTPFLYVFIYSIITDYIRQTRVYDNGMLQLPRAKLAISDVVKISVEEQETILSPIKVCYVFTRDEKCYRVSIAEPHDFVRDLKQYNKDIIVEQPQL